jgi:V/A-type H+/Na+-transporting ATPase subunit I
MIIPMAKVRILGPRDQLDPTLRAIQDLGQLQLADSPTPSGVQAAHLDARSERRRTQLSAVLTDVDGALHDLGIPVAGAPQPSQLRTALAPDFARWARLASRTRAASGSLRAKETALTDERALIARYRDFLEAVLPGVRKVAGSPRLTSHAVVVPAAASGTIDPLAAALRVQLGAEFSMTAHQLPGGDVALLLVLPKEFSSRLEERLAEARVPEVPLPESYRHVPLEEAMPRMLARLFEIPSEIQECRRQRSAIAASTRQELLRAREAIADWSAAAAAHEQSAVTAHAFTIEGWLPERSAPELERLVRKNSGPSVVVERIAREEWGREDAPVVLSNPRLFRPFETLLTLLPLPRYGSIDPTPFVAVFFPLIFGMMLGDVGYGVLLAAIALLVHRKAKPGTLLFKGAEIAGPCAAFAIIFGVLFGEYFGDLGARTLGLRAIAFDREKAIFATLAAAVGLGVVHVVLGLVLGAVTAGTRDKKKALGQGTSAVMVLLVVAALLAAFEVLPSRFFTPAVIALLVAFPLLVFAEGLIAPLELLATLGNVLSYARIMAIGTASVMLAIVANQMVGAVGSTVVGLMFALLFHLVNFAIGLFSPAVHSLRLQYVEFFGKFYSPGGRRYEPFRHRAPQPAPTSTRSSS